MVLTSVRHGGKRLKNQSKDQIKRLEASKAAPSDSDGNTSAKVPRNNKARTDVLPVHNHQGKKKPKHKFS